LGSWSPKGDELSFWTTVGTASRLQRARLPDLKLTALELGPLEAATEVAPQWTARGDLLIQAAQGPRHDWFVVSPRKSPRNLTAMLDTMPKLLLPLSGRETFVAVTPGMLWRFALSGRAPQPSDGVPVPGIEALEPVSFENSRDDTDLMVRGGDPGSVAHFTIDRGSGTLTRLAQPEPGAQLGAWSSRGKAAVFYSNGPRGTFLWRTSPQGTPEVLRATNRWLEHIAPGELRSFDYQSLDGQKLKAWLILPPGYQQGRRYPLLTWVYAGDVQGGRPNPETLIGSPLSLNLQLAAAKGYAVLLPSMPLKGTKYAHDVLAGLQNGVLPAVDQAIADGLADPERLFVAGHSFGGFSTYGLITQTRRFKAAIAMAGMADFVSYFGSVDASFRYGDSLPDLFFIMETVENGQAGLGNPPWKDPDRYRRNSPLTYVDRVDTPLLMIHGDMDPIPLEQAEEFFASLYRQGKPAQLIRYWGESHVIHSPANVRDMWSRIFAWLDRYGDIARDSAGDMLFDGDHARSRAGAPPLEAADFLKLEPSTN
jgi:dipeptidyl aminopeptidase/acylaminoacyl peptidase